MTKYEMLQLLLNEESFQSSLTSHIGCDRAQIVLSETDDQEYLLDVKVVDFFYDQELVMYTETFEIELDYRGSIRSFLIRFNDRATVNEALESANLGKIIEDFLKSKLN